MGYNSNISQGFFPSREQAWAGTPQIGMDPNIAGGIASIPAFVGLAALASGKGGKAVDRIGQLLGGLPGQIISLQNESDAAAESRNARERTVMGISNVMGQSFIPKSRHVGDVDPTLGVFARLSSELKGSAEEENQALSEAKAQRTASGVQLAPEIEQELSRNVSRSYNDAARTKVQSMFESVREYYNNVKMTLAEYDTKLSLANQQTTLNLVGQMAQVLVSSAVTIPSNGIFNFVNQGMAAYNQYQDLKMQLASAEEQASTMAQGQMVGGGISGAMGLASAGIGAGGQVKAAQIAKA